MKYRLLIALLFSGGILGMTALAGIPLPDVILYGQVFIDRTLQRAADDISVIARVDGVSDPVGSYHLGDNSNAGDHYVLRIRVESLADGSSQSRNAALVGQTVHIFVRKGIGPEQRFADYVIPGQGHSQYMDLGAHLRGDWNGDTRIALDDYLQLRDCLQGPAGNPSAQCLAVFDFDGNLHVDMADWRSFQTAFTGR